jgi:FlaA1/EpsC-like NDP-sugar epimerase
MANTKKNILNNSVVFITGGTGSWGNELVRQLLENYKPKEIRIFSRGELKQVEMKRKFKDPRIRYFIGDVRDKKRLAVVLKDVDFVFHLAALKHVPICEENPWEAVQTNIIGTQNIIEASIENNVRKVIDVSTDKAVDPFNLYGVTKACGEKLIIASNNFSKDTRFVCIRGGNVLGTNGSVIPLFAEQIRKLNKITITDRNMTRFLMRVEDAIRLVLHAVINSYGGEVFVMKTPSVKIQDLADVMIKRIGNSKTKIKIIGIRPGEKMNEVLVSRYEMDNTCDSGNYFTILPQIDIPWLEKYYKNKRKVNSKMIEFSSSNTKILNPEEIEKMLEKDGWFDNSIEKDAVAYLKTLDKKNLEDFFK